MADVGGGPASALQNSFQFDMDETIGEGYKSNTRSRVVQTTKVRACFRNGKLSTLFPDLRGLS